MKYLKFLVVFFLGILFALPGTTCEASPAFVNVVNPVRGGEFWELKNQKVEEVFLGQLDILNKFRVSGTWLLRFDALNNSALLSHFNKIPETHEKGLFLEVTPSWAQAAGVEYRGSSNWHAAASALLTGYDPKVREKLIDTAFAKFKEIFGYYPKSVGAWWIDGHSLKYLSDKYKIEATLIVSDQFSTDGYQVWGQYWSAPYYPSANNALYPAKTIQTKIPLVMMQWATRDPVNGYGRAVEESTYSLQPNDYIDYHFLDTEYFKKLANAYLFPEFNQFGQLVVGLENTYSWASYAPEYERQIEYLNSQKVKDLQFVTMSEFSKWYKSQYPDVSPNHLFFTDDPLGSGKKAIWFMTPYYRAGWIWDLHTSYFRDIKQYVDGQEELCKKDSCHELNFATNPTRTLDFVSFDNRWILDEGESSKFNLKKIDQGFALTYLNNLGKLQEVKFLNRDIGVGDKIFSVDEAILTGISQSKNQTDNNNLDSKFLSKISSVQLLALLINLLKFVVFLFLVIFIPGFFLSLKLKLEKNNQLQLIFISICTGLVTFTLYAFLAGLLGSWWLLVIYGILCLLLLFIKFKYFQGIFKLSFKQVNIYLLALIVLGTIFQVLPVFRSGMIFDYGMGFWGPNGHDGVWHLSLTSQIIKNIPPENPIFSGETLKNYHYFYDLLVASTSYLSSIPVVDLIFRLFPIIFSILLGVGTYSLSKILFNSQIASLISVYLVYFSGSFGWIVEYLREKHFGGESAFLVNQSASFNLNPPFAISLILLIGLFHLIVFSKDKRGQWLYILMILLGGSLLGFKAYAAILFLTSLLILGIINLFKKDLLYLKVFFGSSVLSIITWLPSLQGGALSSFSQALFFWSPFGFVHLIIDAPDRVGWVKLSQARLAYFERGEWLKYILVEGLGLAIFIVGNLGVRFVSLLAFFKNEIVQDKTLTTFILIFSGLSALIPLLIIQAGNPWNTVQFFYYLLFTTSLFAGIVLTRIILKLKIVGIILVGLLLILAPINSVVTALSYHYPYPHAFISSKELEALNTLKSFEDGKVLAYPFVQDKKSKFLQPYPLFVYETSAYVSAISGKAVFLEDEIQNDILQTNFKERLIQSKQFFGNTLNTDILKSQKVRYIYLNKSFLPSLSGDKIKAVFENSEVLIYEII